MKATDRKLMFVEYLVNDGCLYSVISFNHRLVHMLMKLKFREVKSLAQSHTATIVRIRVQILTLI